jgi:hypothetical protein
LRDLDAFTRNIGSAALSGGRFAPQFTIAFNAGDSSAQLPFPYGENGAWTASNDQTNERQNEQQAAPHCLSLLHIHKVVYELYSYLKLYDLQPAAILYACLNTFAA